MNDTLEWNIEIYFLNHDWHNIFMKCWWLLVALQEVVV